jgi:SUN domain-containing protein 1/2
MTDDPHAQPFSEAEPDAPSVPSFSIGAILGRVVNRLVRLLMSILGAILYLFAGIVANFFDLVIATPIRWLFHPGNARTLISWVIIPLVVSALLWQTVPSGINWLRSSSFSSPSPIHEYVPPSTPPVDISDLSQRLTDIERALVSISRSQADSIGVVNRLGEMESRVQRESARAQTLEGQLRSAATQGLADVRRELDAIRFRMEQAASKQDRSEPGEMRMIVDEETKDRLRTLEDRMGGVEGEVKEALELGKSAASQPTTGAGGVSRWLPKLGHGSSSSAQKSVTIKSTDGQDVTGLISQLVDSAVSLRGKDDLARADFAAYAAGARVIPSYTSDTYELRPTTWRGLALGLLTGNGYAIGRPPVTALDPDRHIGQCWAFHGDQGSLGVVLARRAFVDAVTIDHVAREVAFDTRSAPREMEVWAMLEGEENLHAVKEWMERRRKEIIEEGGEEEELNEARIQEEIKMEFQGGELPAVLRSDVDYVKLASFEYDAEAEENVQTFEVREMIREMKLDFGIVVLVMKSNWGHDFTCLYRFRVHGEMMVEDGLDASQ